MSRRCLLAALVVFFVQSALAGGPAMSANSARELLTFDAVLEEIRDAQQTGVWNSPDWKPSVASCYLNYLIAEVRQATERDDLKLPIDFSNLKPAPLNRNLLSEHGRLHVVKDANLRHPCCSLVLADSQVSIDFAENCIIIARGAVHVRSSKNSIILAGHYVEASDCATRQPFSRHEWTAAMPLTTNLIMSGDVLHVSSAERCICCGLNGLEFTWRPDTETIALNSPPFAVKHFFPREDEPVEIKTIRAPRLPFSPTLKPTRLDRKLQLVDTERRCVVVRELGVEYRLQSGAPVTDAKGRPFPGLEEWKLSYVGVDYALFTDGRQFAGSRVKGAR